MLGKIGKLTVSVIGCVKINGHSLRHITYAAKPLCFASSCPRKILHIVIRCVKKMIPKELSVLLDGLEFEDNGGVMLKSVDSDDQTLLLSLCIRTGQEDEPDQPWTIRCRGVRKESICFEWPTPYWKKRSTRFYGRT